MSRLDEIYGLSGFSMNFGLERIKALMRYAGNPQDKLKIVHIAGTNGKGSVSRFIYSILKEHGLKIGLYTSPHLITFAERIVVGGEKINDSDLERLNIFFDKIVSEKNDFKKLGAPSFFELTTAICFLYFFEKQVDVAIIEAGLGGRLDATNVIKRPLLSVITNISMDHKNILGNSLEKIAMDKAGIIKRDSAVVCGDRKSRIAGLIKDYALSLNAKYFSVENIKLFKKGDLYNYKGLKTNIENIRLPSKASYQKYNLKLSIFSVEILNKYCQKMLNLELNDNSIKNGILKFSNEGRFEIIKYKNNEIVLDGAHNPDGVKNLIISLRKIFKKNGFIIIFAVMKDKDYKTILRRLSVLNGDIIFTGLNNGRALDGNELKAFSVKNGYFKKIFISENIKDSLETALKRKKKDDAILVCGSLYLVGEFKKTILN
ncbi:MAG: bifunctional folylpolyglutamate synthase/dihydrofolate synthase [bacterium]